MSNIKIPPTKNISSKFYKCSCGKTYLSSAALFTHNKIKHSQLLLQPILQNCSSSQQTHSSMLSDNNSIPIIIKDRNCGIKVCTVSLKSIQDDDKNKGYWKGYSQIFIYLKQLDHPQKIPLNIWQQINSFKNLEEFLDNNSQKKKQLSKGVCLGYGLSQFLKNILLSTEPWRFQQVLILFMLLLQYAIDQSNSQLIISQASVQILIQYMNPFINYHIDDFAEYLGIKGLWIINKINIHHFFMCFYKWLKWKDYTNFCITLID